MEYSGHDKTCRTCGKTAYCTEQGNMVLLGFMVDCPMWQPRIYTTSNGTGTAENKP